MLIGASYGFSGQVFGDVGVVLTDERAQAEVLNATLKDRFSTVTARVGRKGYQGSV